MRTLSLSCIFFFWLHSSIAQTITMGLMHQEPGNQSGAVLFAPIGNKKTYLIDKCGYMLHSWTSTYRPGVSVYLLEDGTLLRAGNTVNAVFSGGGGAGGAIEKLDWNGNVVWSYVLSDSFKCLHHDIKALPNGNILVLMWEAKTRAEAIAAGKDSTFLGTSLWNEKILELQPIGTNAANIVWEWSCWDHLIQELDSTKANYATVVQHPERIHVNANPTLSSNQDWTHLNSIDYNPYLDQILVSSRILGEVWILDHSTTTAQASTHSGGVSGKGGDLLYRWGNPRVYNRGGVVDQQFFGQHSAHWIAAGLTGAGDIMVFNNGKDRIGGDYSSVDIIKPPLNSTGAYSLDVVLPFAPDSAYWRYTDSVPAHFYSNNISGAQRLPNGNTLICSGNIGLFFEVDSLNHVVWRYKNPVNVLGPATQGTTIFNNTVFRAVFYDENYAGFAGHTLIPGAPIELSPVSYSCSMPLGEIKVELNDDKPLVYPNPMNDVVWVKLKDERSRFWYEIVDVAGRRLAINSFISGEPINVSGFPAGVYLLNLKVDEKRYFYKLVK